MKQLKNNGQGLVEYAIILGLIALVVIMVMQMQSAGEMQRQTPANNPELVKERTKYLVIQDIAAKRQVQLDLKTNLAAVSTTASEEFEDEEANAVFAYQTTDIRDNFGGRCLLYVLFWPHGAEFPNVVLDNSKDFQEEPCNWDYVNQKLNEFFNACSAIKVSQAVIDRIRPQIEASLRTNFPWWK